MTTPDAGARPSRSRAVALCGLVLLVQLGLCLAAKPGFLADDDLGYAVLANQAREGHLNLTRHPISHRFAVFIPTALAYRLWGVGPWTTILWPLGCSLAGTFLVFLAGLRRGLPVAFLASFLLAANPLWIEYSLLLMPDLVVGVIMFATVLCLEESRRRAPSKGAAILGIGFGLLVILGFTAKETVLWTIPLAAVLLSLDLARRNDTAPWRWALPSLLVFGCVYLGAYFLATGDPLYRLYLVESRHNVSPWSYLNKPLGDLLQRVTWRPLLLLFENPPLLVPLIMAAIPGLNGWGEKAQARPPLDTWRLYSLVALLAYWFGTTSLSAYNPLPLMPRMLLPLLPPLCLVAAGNLAALLSDRVSEGAARFSRRGILTTAALLVLAAASMVLKTPFMGYTLAAIPFAVIAARPPEQKEGRKRLAAAVCATAFFVAGLMPVLNREIGRTPELEAERRIFNEYLSRLPEPATVITDNRSVFALMFHNGFAPTPRLSLVSFDNPPPGKTGGSRRFVYLNLTRIDQIYPLFGYRIPDFVRTPPAAWTLVRGEGQVRLYELPDPGQGAG